MTKKERIAELKRVHRGYLHKTREMGYKCSIEEYLVDNNFGNLSAFIDEIENELATDIQGLASVLIATEEKSEQDILCERMKTICDISILLDNLKIQWGISTNGLRN